MRISAAEGHFKMPIVEIRLRVTHGGGERFARYRLGRGGRQTFEQVHFCAVNATASPVGEQMDSVSAISTHTSVGSAFAMSRRSTLCKVATSSRISTGLTR